MAMTDWELVYQKRTKYGYVSKTGRTTCKEWHARQEEWPDLETKRFIHVATKFSQNS